MNRERFLQLLPAIAALVGVVAAVVFLLATVSVLRAHRETNEKICRSAVENRAAVRLTWDAARDLVLGGVTDDARIERTNEFFNAVLKQVPPLECEGTEPVVRR